MNQIKIQNQDLDTETKKRFDDVVKNDRDRIIFHQDGLATIIHGKDPITNRELKKPEYNDKESSRDKRIVKSKIEIICEKKIKLELSIYADECKSNDLEPSEMSKKLKQSKSEISKILGGVDIWDVCISQFNGKDLKSGELKIVSLNKPGTPILLTEKKHYEIEYQWELIAMFPEMEVVNNKEYFNPELPFNVNINVYASVSPVDSIEKEATQYPFKVTF